MDNAVNITLSPEEVNFVLQVLGELPTRTGAFPLMVRIREQAQSQLPAPPAAE